MIEVTAIGNAGFKLCTGRYHIYVDAFYHPIPSMIERPVLRPKKVEAADLLLITHAHPDHFDAEAILEVCQQTNAKVVGPRSVIQALKRKLPEGLIVEMEPPTGGNNQQISSMIWQSADIQVTAFRTSHGNAHNSYLVETPEVRFFDDGDNENTRILPVKKLVGLDALFIAPWKGSGWVEFIEKISPPRYIMIHLDREEIDQHERGKFLPEICDHVPPGLLVLRSGDSIRFSAGMVSRKGRGQEDAG